MDNEYIIDMDTLSEMSLTAHCAVLAGFAKVELEAKDAAKLCEMSIELHKTNASTAELTKKLESCESELEQAIGLARKAEEREQKAIKHAAGLADQADKSYQRLFNILEDCIDTKGQRAVSLSRLAEVLGVDMLTDIEQAALVESRKVVNESGREQYKIPNIPGQIKDSKK